MKNRIMIREPTEKILKHIEHKVREGERVLNEFRLGEFDDAVRLLKPLKEIKDIGCSEDFNNIVIVRARPVITDMRSPLDRFLAGLHEYLGRDERAEKKPEEEDSKSKIG